MRQACRDAKTRGPSCLAPCRGAAWRTCARADISHPTRDYSARCVECISDADCGAQERCEDTRCQPIPPLMCDDGIQNGDEWEVDCGGGCPRCLGHFCSTGSACWSGFCADGVCCNAPCDAFCVSCFDGDCKNVAQYQDDPPVCFGVNTCNGGGECRLDNPSPCMAPVDCASGKCENFTCVP